MAKGLQMSLIDEVRQALKLNDPDYMEAITEIKKRYVSQGVPIETMRSTIREIIHEYKQPAAMPEPEAPQPVTPEPPKAVQDRRTDKELSARAPRSNKPIPDNMTESGTRKTGAAGGRSIFDFIDEKK